jgi:hypothetical protein
MPPSTSKACSALSAKRVALVVGEAELGEDPPYVALDGALGLKPTVTHWVPG